MSVRTGDRLLTIDCQVVHRDTQAQTDERDGRTDGNGSRARSEERMTNILVARDRRARSVDCEVQRPSPGGTATGDSATRPDPNRAGAYTTPYIPQPTPRCASCERSARRRGRRDHYLLLPVRFRGEMIQQR